MGEACQLFKSNERNRKLCTKLDYFLLFGHKLSWAIAHFITCNDHPFVRLQSNLAPDEVSNSPRKLVPK